MHSHQFITTGEDDTRRLAECMAAGLDGVPGATVIALEGELGAGKTRFVRGLAAGLGVDLNAIASPTFVLAVEHRGAFGVTLAHLDAWRVRSVEELESVGWEEMLRRPQCVIAVEWASKIASALPSERIDVTIEHLADGERAITIDDRRDEASVERMQRAISLYAPSTGARERRCPTCGTTIRGEVATFPFCSPRCRMADLGRWFSGSYTISRPIERDEELSD
jgi:tRNA threonylcarbamoyladenosine biosynthesis protein TsaE